MEIDILIDGFKSEEKAQEVTNALCNWSGDRVYKVGENIFGGWYIEYPVNEVTPLQRRCAVAFVQGFCYKD